MPDRHLRYRQRDRLHKQNVRPALMELRAAGLADERGSTKGRIKIFAWAVRRPVSQRNGNSRNYHFVGAPPELQALWSRFKISLAPDFVLSLEYPAAVEEAACKYQNAEMVLKSMLKGNRASEPPDKEKRNEINIAGNAPSLSKQVHIPEEPTTTESVPSKDSPRPEPRTAEALSETGGAAAARVSESRPIDSQIVLKRFNRSRSPWNARAKSGQLRTSGLPPA